MSRFASCWAEDGILARTTTAATSKRPIQALFLVPMISISVMRTQAILAFFSLTPLVHRFILHHLLRENLVYFLATGTPLPLIFWNHGIRDTLPARSLS